MQIAKEITTDPNKKSGVVGEIAIGLNPPETKPTGVRLAVTPPELLVEGIPAALVDRVCAKLEEIVARSPQMNVYPTLVGLARGIAKTLRR